MDEIYSNCYSGKIELVQDQLNLNPNLLTTADKDGRLPIHHAVSGSQIRIVSFLIGLKTPLDVADESDWTLTHIAASIGNLEILKLLGG